MRTWDRRSIIDQVTAFLSKILFPLKEYIQYRKQLQIIKLFGTIDYDEDYDYKKQRQKL